MGKVTYNFEIVMQEGSLSFLPSIAVGYFDLELNRTVYDVVLSEFIRRCLCFRF